MTSVYLSVLLISLGCTNDPAPFTQDSRLPGVVHHGTYGQVPSDPSSGLETPAEASDGGNPNGQRPFGGAATTGSMSAVLEGVSAEMAPNPKSEGEQEGSAGMMGTFEDGFGGTSAHSGGSPGDLGGVAYDAQSGGYIESGAGGQHESDTSGSMSGGAEVDLANDVPLVECARISELNPDWHVCDESTDACSGVFTDGAGCQAFCSAAGLVCTARYEGGRGCKVDRTRPLPCRVHTDHRSDWCECGRPADA